MVSMFYAGAHSQVKKNIVHAMFFFAGLGNAWSAEQTLTAMYVLRLDVVSRWVVMSDRVDNLTRKCFAKVFFNRLRQKNWKIGFRVSNFGTDVSLV